MPAQLKRPVGFPTTYSSTEEEAWSTLISSQLSDVRKVAENWRNGLVALIGLITSFSVIKGPDNVTGLEIRAAHTVGLLLSLALISAIFGAWSSLSAAYGTPSVFTREEFRNLGGINGYRLDLARKSLAHLHRAQVATIATLIFLSGAVGVTWYGPQLASTAFDIESIFMQNICGDLLPANNG